MKKVRGARNGDVARGSAGKRKSDRIADKQKLVAQLNAEIDDDHEDEENDDGYVRAPALPKKKKKYFCCRDCEMSTDDYQSLRRHIKQQHGFFSAAHGKTVVERVVCSACKMVILKMDNFTTHVKRHHAGKKVHGKIEKFVVE